ncbi:MAG: hypothetical protein WCS52_04660 [bacterium]
MDKIQTSTLEIYSADVVIKRWNNQNNAGKKQIGAARGIIAGFSSGSAREFCRQVRNQPLLNRTGVSGMATATYGTNIPKDSLTVRLHIKRMTMRLTRDEIGGYYMIEFQEARRAIHVHWILSQAIEPQAWGMMWVEASEQTHDTDAVSVACHKKSSQIMKSARGASFYASKYASKAGLQKVVPDDFSWSGRWWGHWGIPIVKPERVEHASAVHHASFRRLFRRKARSEAQSYYRSRLVGQLNHDFRVDNLIYCGNSLKDAVMYAAQGYGGNWGAFNHQGHYLWGWSAVSKQLRQVMAKEGIRPPKRSKDWNKLTLYGQAGFVRSNEERIQSCCYTPETKTVMNFFQGKLTGSIDKNTTH